jgi:hypothetical protein
MTQEIPDDVKRWTAKPLPDDIALAITGSGIVIGFLITATVQIVRFMILAWYRTECLQWYGEGGQA